MRNNQAKEIKLLGIGALDSRKVSTAVVSILHCGQSELPQTSQTVTAFMAGKNTKVVFFRSGEYQSRISIGT